MAVLFLSALFSLTAAGAVHWPEDETPEERYWKKLHEKEAKQAEREEQQQRGAREQAIAALAETVEAGALFQSQIILDSDGPPPPPPKPSWFRGKGDYVMLACMGVFLSLLSISVIVRHKREAKISELCGGYLSDGTEVAKYKLPEWWAPSAAEDGVTKEEVGVAANSSSAEYVSPEPVAKFLEQAPGQLARLREILQAVSFAVEPAERGKSLESLRDVLCELKASATCWHLRPAWQMASVLELLVKRIIDKPKNVTSSVIRTIASALDTLQEVCMPGVRPNLIIDPPIKVLAVDDEPLCRRALQFALQNANLSADLAQSGEQAVQFAENAFYDVVLMDIQMSGIDGLTACRQILQTDRNSDVPVIFVTVQSDFDTRAKARLEGGVDMMAKPYLVLELTVKAVTFAMRKRLHVAGRRRSESIVTKTAVPMVQVFANGAAAPLAGNPELVAQAPIDSAIQSDLPALESFDLEGDFFLEVPKYLRAAQKALEDKREELDAAKVQSMIGDMYLRIHKVATRATLMDLGVTEHVSSTLEALLKRLYNNPKTITISTLHTVSKALKLMGRMCVPGLEARLTEHSPVRILVVEDEPLARRAVVGALQLAFEKPESAENGAQALQLARTKSYDVIFTDVEMPEMDGFGFCTELRADGINRKTPVVFITNLNNIEAQAEALESGGNDFIAKPFLPIEIAVKAMTFAWEGRLRKLDICLNQDPSVLHATPTGKAPVVSPP
jgi:CheY-like chemotaxis protein